ncbi:MAG TPA: hypothetical protein ACFYD3_03610 [Candidatus Hypogeohydataceae bacterium YC41]
MILLVLSLSLLFLESGCAATQGTTVGMAGGAAAGAGIGAALGATPLGAIIGLGLGAIGGTLVQDHLDKKQAEKEKKELEEKLETVNPTASAPQKNFIQGHYEYIQKKRWIDTSRSERVWVEERLEDGKKTEGHFEERLVPSGYWEEIEEKVWLPDHYE